MTAHNEKRQRVLSRLSQPDAKSLSDRAIARQCGVSQPFVGKLRRSLSKPLQSATNVGVDNDHATRKAQGLTTDAPLSQAEGVRVRAIEMGFYGGVRRRVGAVFTLADSSHFSERWMVRV